MTVPKFIIDAVFDADSSAAAAAQIDRHYQGKYRPRERAGSLHVTVIAAQIRSG